MMKKRWLWLFVTLILVGGYVSETIQLSPEITGSAVRKFQVANLKIRLPISNFETVSSGPQTAMNQDRPQFPQVGQPSLTVLDVMITKIKVALYQAEFRLSNPLFAVMRPFICLRLGYLMHFVNKLIDLVFPYALDPQYQQRVNELYQLRDIIDFLIRKHCVPEDFEPLRPIDNLFTNDFVGYTRIVEWTLSDFPLTDPPETDNPIRNKYIETSPNPITPPCSPLIVFDPQHPYKYILCAGNTISDYGSFFACGALSIRVVSEAIPTVETIYTTAATHSISRATVNVALARAAAQYGGKVTVGAANGVLATLTANSQQFATDNDPTISENAFCDHPSTPGSGSTVSPASPVITTPTDSVHTPNVCTIDPTQFKLTIEKWAASPDNYWPGLGIAARINIDIPRDLKHIVDHPPKGLYPSNPAVTGYLDPDAAPLQNPDPSSTDDDARFTFETNPKNDLCGRHYWGVFGKFCTYESRFFIIGSPQGGFDQARRICEKGVIAFIRVKDCNGNSAWVYWRILCNPLSDPNNPTYLLSQPQISHTPPHLITSSQAPPAPPSTGPGTPGGNCALDANNQCSGNCPQGETCGSPSAGSCQCCPANCAVGVECQSDAECDDHDQGTTDKCKPKPNCTLQCGTQCTHISIPPT